MEEDKISKTNLNRISIAQKVYKKTIAYQLSGSYLNKQGCAVDTHSDEYLDEHPGADRISKIYDYDHPKSKLLCALKEGRDIVVTYREKGDSELPIDVEIV